MAAVIVNLLRNIYSDRPMWREGTSTVRFMAKECHEKLLMW
ncbi:MAG: hypothetical protein VKL42_18835 [Snowella sp.]|nr:hypothetical protein [Snowella sp.]